MNSPLLALFISYRSSGEKLIKYQANSSCVIMSVILMTTLSYKTLILQGEIWCWSLLGLKGLIGYVHTMPDSFCANPKNTRIGLLFTHKNDDFTVISVNGVKLRLGDLESGSSVSATFRSNRKWVGAKTGTQWHGSKWMGKIRSLSNTTATSTATASKTSLKKWSRPASNFIALIASRSVRQMLAIFSGDEF